MATRGKISVGTGKSCINPPLGMELSGFGFYLGRGATGIHDDLFARAITLDDGRSRAALIACDLIGLEEKFVWEIKSEIEGRCEVPRSNILLALTHTHSGPATMFLRGCGEFDPGWMGSLREAIVRTVVQASENMRPAVLRMGIGEARIGYNRVRKDDTIDPQVIVISFANDAGEIAYLVNYACHPVTLAKQNTLISADYPGAVVRYVEEHTGAFAAFFSGACGDIDPLVNRDEWGSGTFEDVARYGEIVGGAAIRAVKSVQPQDDISLEIEEMRVDLPLQAPSVDEIREKLAGSERRVEREYFKSLLQRVESGKMDRALSVPIQILTLGGAQIFALPGEVFVEIGLALKSLSQKPVSGVIGYANACPGYLPTRYDFEIRGYASTLAPMIYDHPPFAPGIEDRIIEAVREYLLKGR
ncbi:MAG: neutral/alkaline non-lysosomal ceramidase N-terminal domain-containing protein [bacterium]